MRFVAFLIWKGCYSHEVITINKLHCGSEMGSEKKKIPSPSTKLELDLSFRTVLRETVNSTHMYNYTESCSQWIQLDGDGYN